MYFVSLKSTQLRSPTFFLSLNTFYEGCCWNNVFIMTSQVWLWARARTDVRGVSWFRLLQRTDKNQQPDMVLSRPVLWTFVGKCRSFPGGVDELCSVDEVPAALCFLENVDVWFGALSLWFIIINYSSVIWSSLKTLLFWPSEAPVGEGDEGKERKTQPGPVSGWTWVVQETWEGELRLWSATHSSCRSLSAATHVLSFSWSRLFWGDEWMNSSNYNPDVSQLNPLSCKPVIIQFNSHLMSLHKTSRAEEPGRSGNTERNIWQGSLNSQ